MIFTTVSKEALMFGQGKQQDQDYCEIMEDVKMYFYDADSIKQDFEKYGLVEFSQMDETNKNMKNKPPSILSLLSVRKNFRTTLY